MRLRGKKTEKKESEFEASLPMDNARAGRDDAEDENMSALKSLREQLDFRPERIHGSEENIRMKLAVKSHCTYGLVFASYVTDSNDDEKDKNDFFRRIKAKAGSLGFVNHDLPAPQLAAIFEDLPVNYLKEKHYVALRVGLWRRKN